MRHLISAVTRGLRPHALLCEAIDRPSWAHTSVTLYERETSEGGFKLNCARVTPAQARAYAQDQCQQAGQDLDVLLPEFDKNYRLIQAGLSAALNIARIDMPVIEPRDMAGFMQSLNAGSLDILQPWARDILATPTDLRGGDEESSAWLSLGFVDGERADDRFKARMTRMRVRDLLPTQNEVWLEKLIGNTIKFGPAKQGTPVTDEAPLIVSTEGYILDGHHRWGQGLLADPDLRFKVLQVPLDIKTLVKVGRSYGNAIGNKQKA